jgi:hypothetical protein
MPKDGPAPRRAQKRSVFCVFDAVTMLELARTTVASIRLSRASPCEWDEKP